MLWYSLVVSEYIISDRNKRRHFCQYRTESPRSFRISRRLFIDIFLRLTNVKNNRYRKEDAIRHFFLIFLWCVCWDPNRDPDFALQNMSIVFLPLPITSNNATVRALHGDWTFVLMGLRICPSGLITERLERSFLSSSVIALRHSTNVLKLSMLSVTLLLLLNC